MVNPITRRVFLKKTGMGAAGLTAAACTPGLRKRLGLKGIDQPNLLFILVDDLGKEWIGCYGGEAIETPHIDALAREGMIFHNAYSMPQCTPSRATLLTGRYPWRTGWVNHWDVPRWGVGYFDWRQEITFARVMKKAGYATAAAGKWQINDFRIEPRAMEKHGFDDWRMWTGYEAGNPPSAERYMNPYIHTPEGSQTYPGHFGPDLYADGLIQFMEQHRDEPMLLYLAMALTHSPLTSTPDAPDIKAQDKTEVFRHMIRYMDKIVGRLTAALESLNLRDRTIVIFTTDNGTGGFRNRRQGRMVRGGKAQKTENGVCNPFIVSCPGRVPTGTETDALTDFSDLLPTFAELGGASLPEGVTLDGHSIAPVILGQAKDSPREWILAMGHGPATLDADGVRGAADYAARVLRDKRYKVWVNEKGIIDRFHDLSVDPMEESNLLKPGESDAATALTTDQQTALAKFQKAVDAMPKKDARIRYEKRPPNPWDKKAGKRQPAG